MSEHAWGWIALLGRHPDDDAPSEVFVFCPVCADHEFRMAPESAQTYT